MAGGPGPRTFDLEISIRVRPTYDPERGGYSSENLSVDDRLSLGELDFLGISGVLGRFHTLVEELRAAANVGPSSSDGCNADAEQIAQIVAAGCTIDDVVRDWPRLAAAYIRSTIEACA